MRHHYRFDGQPARVIARYDKFGVTWVTARVGQVDVECPLAWLDRA